MTAAVPPTWTRRAARRTVRPAVGSRLRPNHITTARILLGALALVAVGTGSRSGEWMGGALWILSAFLDRCDGEYARMADLSTPFGHRYDTVGDWSLNALFFLSLGIGGQHGHLGEPAIWVGALGAAGVFASSLLAYRIERRLPGRQKAFSGALGFDFDDVIYLLGPLLWAGAGPFLLVGAAIFSPAVAVVLGLRLARPVRAANRPKTGPGPQRPSCPPLPECVPRGPTSAGSAQSD